MTQASKPIVQDVMKYTERYDLSIPTSADGDVRKYLQKTCEKYDIWPFRVTKGKKGTAVSFIRNPSTLQYIYTDSMTKLVNSLKMDLCITTIIMRRTSGRINVTKLPKEIHNICQDTTDTYSVEEKQMLTNLEEDMSIFNSHAIQQLEESDYDTAEARKANKHAANRQRFERRCPLREEDAPIYYSNGRQKTIEGQMALDFDRLMKVKR